MISVPNLSGTKMAETRSSFCGCPGRLSASRPSVQSSKRRLRMGRPVRSTSAVRDSGRTRRFSSFPTMPFSSMNAIRAPSPSLMAMKTIEASTKRASSEQTAWKRFSSDKSLVSSSAVRWTTSRSRSARERAARPIASFTENNFASLGWRPLSLYENKTRRPCPEQYCFPGQASATSCLSRSALRREDFYRVVVVVVEVELGVLRRRAGGGHSEDRAGGARVDVLDGDDFAGGREFDDQVLALRVERVSERDISAGKQRRADGPVERLTVVDDVRVGCIRAAERQAVDRNAVILHRRNVVDGVECVVVAVDDIQQIAACNVVQARRSKDAAGLAAVDREAAGDDREGSVREIDADQFSGLGVRSVKRRDGLVARECDAPRAVPDRVLFGRQ